MTDDVDESFYDRADEHINLANDQGREAARGKVSASFMYAVARYNAWVSASGFSSGADMKAAQVETIAFFTKQYQSMLEENLNDYSKNFDCYMKAGMQ